jgi:hypothetical protein
MSSVLQVMLVMALVACTSRIWIVGGWNYVGTPDKVSVENLSFI